MHDVEHRRHHDDAEERRHEIDPRRALALHRRADSGEQHREGRADRDAEQQRQRRVERERARDGQRLQNTDRRACGLQQRRECRTHKDAKQGIRHAGHRLGEPRLIAETVHRAGHGAHAEHQNGKAHQDIAHMLVRLVLGEHAQHDADHGHDARECRGGKDAAQTARALNVAQADHPARDARAENRAENDGDRLPQLHHGGVHEADCHDARRAGGLDHRRHARAEQHAAQLCAGQAVEDRLQLVAGDGFQSVAHQRHAEEKQRHAAQQRNDFRNTHLGTPFVPF